MKYTILLVTVLSSFMFKNNVLAVQPTVNLFGIIEIESSYNQPYSGSATSTLDLAKVELGLTTQINKHVSAEIILLHEENNLDVDTVMLAFNDSNLTFIAGQIYLPFGRFNTNMLSDPLTHYLAETREAAIQLTYEVDNFSSSFYIFNGDNKQYNGTADKVDNFGLNARISYINDIGDSNNLQDTIKTNLGNNKTKKHIAGIGISTVIEIQNIQLIAEYISAIDNFAVSELSFNGYGAKPNSMNIEAGYNFKLLNKLTNIGIAYQTTKQALGLGLEKSSLSTTISFHIMKNTDLMFEFSKKKDYSTNDGGTGNTSKSVAAKLSVEF